MLAAVGPSALWYLTRGTGTTATILLTISVALGVADVRRVQTAGLPRFVFDDLHRNVSLLAIVFLFVHIVTSVLDPFAPLRLVDTVIPFVSAYRPLWLGLGAVAFDLLIAVAVTSIFRRRVGYAGWRAIHFLSYATWPLAIVHGFGTGSDAKSFWMIALTVVCVVIVLVAVAARVAAGWPERKGIRLSAMSAAAFMPLGLLVWLPLGPLAHGWARRAGTPSSLLAAAATSSAGASRPRATSSSPAPSPFNAAASGSISQGPISGGRYAVRIALKLAGEHLSTMRVRIFGQPLGNGGVSMTASSVSLGTDSDPTMYRGEVTGLAGTTVEAHVRDAAGNTLALVAQLQIGGQSVTGTVSAQPSGTP